jgi:hypothetical protein
MQQTFKKSQKSSAHIQTVLILHARPKKYSSRYTIPLKETQVRVLGNIDGRNARLFS